jgi:hypothetical protein
VANDEVSKVCVPSLIHAYSSVAGLARCTRPGRLNVSVLRCLRRSERQALVVPPCERSHNVRCSAR